MSCCEYCLNHMNATVELLYISKTGYDLVFVVRALVSVCLCVCMFVISMYILCYWFLIIPHLLQQTLFSSIIQN